MTFQSAVCVARLFQTTLGSQAPAVFLGCWPQHLRHSCDQPRTPPNFVSAFPAQVGRGDTAVRSNASSMLKYWSVALFSEKPSQKCQAPRDLQHRGLALGLLIASIPLFWCLCWCRQLLHTVVHMASKYYHLHIGLGTEDSMVEIAWYSCPGSMFPKVRSTQGACDTA